MLAGPILSTLVRLSLPNMLAMLAMALVTIAETTYVGRLGTPPLAGLALVFPLVMLQQMLSGGAVGGGVSSAISRALGAGDERRASSLAFQAVIIGVAFGAISTIAMMGFGEPVYRLLGGRDAALSEALIYSNVVFFGAVGIWLTNMLAAVIRAGGNMRVPSVAMVSTSIAQVVLGGALGFGLGVGGMSFPRLGMAGIALGQVLAYSGCALFFVWYLTSPYARILLSLRNASLRWDHIRDILACRSACLHIACAIDSRCSHSDPPRCKLRDRVTGRLRHRDAPGVPADPSVVRCRRDVRLDGRHGDRGGQRCARTPRRMDWRRLRSAIGRHDRTDRSCLA